MALPGEATVSDTYGGPYTNERPVEDPTTEVDEGAFNEFLADTAAATRMVPRAWVKFAGLTYTSGTQSIPVDDHNAVWGGAIGVKASRYAVGSRRSTSSLGRRTAMNELGETHTLNIRYPDEPMTNRHCF